MLTFGFPHPSYVTRTANERSSRPSSSDRPSLGALQLDGNVTLYTCTQYASRSRASRHVYRGTLRQERSNTHPSHDATSHLPEEQIWSRLPVVIPSLPAGSLTFISDTAWASTREPPILQAFGADQVPHEHSSGPIPVRGNSPE